MTDLKDYGLCLAIQKCPQCHKKFKLVWDWAYVGEENWNNKETLGIRACPSGGIYGVSINCPFCDYEEEL